jgi:hypothetical protein
MAFFTKGEMQSRGNRILAEQQRFGKSTRTIFAEATTFDPEKTYDVFLSHSSRDKPLVLGVKARLEDENLSVYIDWIDDADLDRAAVTPENARRLRRRMKQCQSLLYIATDNASRSKWMPWEVGLFDGLGKGERIGVLPVLDSATEKFDGMEFLGLYSVVDLRRTRGGDVALFASTQAGDVMNFKRLLREAD